MTKFFAACASAVLGVMPFAAAAQSGDAAAGEAAFRGCQACHVVENDAGEVLAGRNGRVGPNLYGVESRAAGGVDGFRYSDSLVEAGEAGLMWDEEAFVAYVQDPTGYLREYLDDGSARGAMSYRVRSEDEARDVYAYIVSLSE